MTVEILFVILSVIRPRTPLSVVSGMRTQRGFCFLESCSMVANGKELPATVEQQAELLLSSGLCGISEQDLISRLKTVSCYRLSNYFYPYMDDSRTFFLENSNWDLIWNDYCMDSRLRSILFVGLSHIEIAFRTQLEVVMAQKYNPQWYADEKNFLIKTDSYVMWQS